MRDYGKVHTRFWSSDTTRGLSDDGRLLALYLITSPHSTIAGVFRLPDGYVCEDMQWTPERVAQGFAELLQKGFANRCETTKWVWVTKHLEWNPPENPNQNKSAIKVAQAVPAEVGWRQEFMRVCGPLMGLEVTPSANPSPTVTKPFANQEPEQKQEQKQDEEPSASAAKLPACPHQKLLEIYAEAAAVLPQPRPEAWGGQRAKHLAARWKWVLTATNKKTGARYAATEQEALDWFRRYFAYASESDFLSGRSGKFNGCDLAWLVNEDNFAKVIQGNYENKEAAHAPR